MSLSTDSNMVMPVTPAYGMGYNNNGGMWGNDWFAWIILLLLFGNRGWGGFGGESSCCAPATCADLQRGFDNQSVMNKLNGLENGLCDGFYAQNTNILNGFHGVDNAVCQLGYQTQQGFSTLGAQLADCCCTTQRAIDQSTFQTSQGINGLSSQLASCCCNIERQVERGFCDTNYNLATNTTAIIQNAHNDTDRVIAKLDAMEMARKDETISELRSQVNALNLAQSQANQNTYLINTLRPCPIPAYPACPPTGAYTWPANGCGCNSGCC